MYIYVGRINGRVSESLGHRLDITAIRKKIGCGRMSQTMKFQMAKSVFLQEFIKLFCWRVRMHDITAPVGKEESGLMPFFTEQGFFTVLLFFQFQ